MPEDFLRLSRSDMREALEQAASLSGRPAFLLEKDVWVVWTLDALMKATAPGELVFKGGTSLSKAYDAINRFSEDVDLTYDIRRLLDGTNGLQPGAGDGMPRSTSQASRWTSEVEKRLPEWIKKTITPLLEGAIQADGLALQLRPGEKSHQLLVAYAPTTDQHSRYVKPEVLLEFGARSTGEPAAQMSIASDAAAHLPVLQFPTASPWVMALERTFWEKATAAHVFCAQGRFRGERFSRHWHDLAALANHPRFPQALQDRDLAEKVARHKAMFFREKDRTDTQIDYLTAVQGQMCIVPVGDARSALELDYQAMLEGRLLGAPAPQSFDQLMAACALLEDQINAAAR